ncbi:MAG: efflux RND transporter periplasmic adaptor subunit [Bacteroidales bacterium]
MNRAVRLGALFGSIVLVAGMVLYPKYSKKDSESVASSAVVPRSRQPLIVRGEVVEPTVLRDKLNATATVLPDEEVDLAFEVSGKVVSISFQEGSRVRKGDLLAKVNDRPLQAQLNKLIAQLPLAKERVFRQKSLLEKDAVSQEAYELVATELSKLEADIELVRANIDMTELRAPFDGVVGLRGISEGAFASPTTIVTKLTKISPLKVEFSFPERYSQAIGRGTMIGFSVDGESALLDARVYAVESMVDSRSRSLKARALYSNSDERILPGRYAGVEVELKEIKGALTIPSEALIPEMGQDIVYLYRSGRAVPVDVTVGLRTESRLQVVEGIALGDTILTTGVMQLRRGMEVSLDRVDRVVQANK